MRTVGVTCPVILLTFSTATSEALEIGDAEKGIALKRTCAHSATQSEKDNLSHRTEDTDFR